MSQESLSKPIAEGRTAEIFAWRDRQILKLYREWCPPQWIEFETKLAHLLQDAGLPVPQVGEIIDYEGRRGLVYERLAGPSMNEAMFAHPWLAFRYGRVLAELHAATHVLSVPDLPSQRDRCLDGLKSSKHLTPELQDAALGALYRLPDGDALCHGDLHPGNVLMTSRGPIIIDWMTATRGNPVADVARTWWLLHAGTPPGLLLRLLVPFLRKRFFADYLSRYAELRPLDQTQFEAWKPMIAALRVNENIPGERERLMNIVRHHFA